jgi:hypothetical protein
MTTTPSERATRRAPGCGVFGRRAAVLVLFAAIVTSAPGAAVDTGSAPVIDLGPARQAFAQAAALSRADGGRLWGVPLYGPMLFVDPVTRQVVANEDAAGTGLQAVEGLFVGTVPVAICCGNTAVTWGGKRWTMVLWPLPDETADRGRLLAHEMFHRVQQGLGLPFRDAVNDHLEEREGRYWMRLEWRALGRALTSAGKARRSAVVDALLFRAARRARIPSAAEAENALELNEGLAEWTGLVLAFAPGRHAAVAAAGLERRDRRADQLSLVRGFAYASGPAYGVLLDAAGARWRRQLNPRSDLGALLATAYRAAPPAAPLAAATAAAARYDGVALAAAEAQRESERRAEEAGLRKRFVDGPRLVLPAGDQLNYSFDPNGAGVLPGVGTIYPSASVSDDWGSLSVTAGGVLLARSEGKITAAVVPAPADLAARPLVGDGWHLELAPGWALVAGARAGDWTVARQPPGN